MNRESLVYRSSGQHQGKIDAYSLRAKERRPKASIASSSIRSAADERAAPSPTTRARTKDGTNRSNAEIGQELTNASFCSHYAMKSRQDAAS